MRIAGLSLLAFTTVLAIGACTQPQDQPPPIQPSGSALLNPSTIPGQSNAITSGSSSNAASGSMIRQQEGPAARLGVPR